MLRENATVGVTHEKPLYVRVAEALGTYTECSPDSGVSEEQPNGSWKDVPQWWGTSPFGLAGLRSRGAIRRYDTEWMFTGPLIERYGINIERAQAARPDGGPYAAWCWADPGDEIPPKKVWGETPLLAVCHLLLALHADGKLKLAA